MDDRRFDRFARLMAGSGSRRGLLGGLAAAVATLATTWRSAPATAQRSSLGPGDSCRQDGQCRDFVYGSPLVCGDNAFIYDGPLNCCTFLGYRCDSDQGCCGTAACINGYCSDNPNLRGPGDPCSDRSQCLGANIPLVCDYVAEYGDSRCCAYEDYACSWDGGCCGSLTCGNDGFCTSATPAHCSWWGCDCDFHIPNYCDLGLVCCALGWGFQCVDRDTCAAG